VPKAWKVITVNVNGVRAAGRRGGLAWLRDSGADVICLQEVRATHDQLHEALAEGGLDTWHVAHAPAPELGRAGVAVLSRNEPVAQRDHVNVDGMDGLGRWIEVDLEAPFGLVTVVSVYVHSGEAGTQKQADKYIFLDAMGKRLAALSRKAKRDESHVLVCGDLNIAHHEVDIKNWKGNVGKAGFLEEERAHLTSWFAKNWVDLGRRFGGEGPGPYTWWSWRGQAFDNDAGWRIDYQLATPALADRAKQVVIGRADTYAERWSDHAPVIVDFS
jgi:exodeoxyribonuclease III